MTPDEDPITSPIKSTPKKLTKRQVRGSLMFETPVKNKPPPVKRASNDDDDDDDIFSGDLLASVRLFIQFMFLFTFNLSNLLMSFNHNLLYIYIISD